MRLVELERDPDVLDTWFSSALWPFATLGWPEDTEDLRRYYPGDVNSTAREIIRLWVNRMIWTGIELVGDIPFHDVIIHSTVLATDGRRMSKSLGTGVDPLEMIDAHGADATRYGLLKMSSTQDVRFSRSDRGGAQARGQALERGAAHPHERRSHVEPDARPQAVEERWILARLDAARAEVEDDWARFDFAAAVKTLYGLTFDDFCDWYAEAIKPRLYEDDPDAAAGARRARAAPRSCCTVMPHVTEEIWARLPARKARSSSPRGRSRMPASPPTPTRSSASATLPRSPAGAASWSTSRGRASDFDAVVRKEQLPLNGSREGESRVSRKEVARSEGMLGNESFVANAPRWSRASAESGALPARARCARRVLYRLARV